MNPKESPLETELLLSALTSDSQAFPTSEILEWLENRRSSVNVVINQKNIDDLRGWKREEGSGHIIHESGRFFRIEGIRVKTDWGLVPTWEQPIINQPEVGFLGFLTKNIGGVLHFLVQAKIEPGNINSVQISPTLQATKSNYTQVHKGKRPLFLEYFNGEIPCEVLLDQLQSEQGARFLRKRNRNIIVKLNDSEKIPEHPDFVWLTLGQIKGLMAFDNTVNMDTRTVVAGISYGSSSYEEALQSAEGYGLGSASERLLISCMQNQREYKTFREILSWITRLKSMYELNVDRIPLIGLRDWAQREGSIRHACDKYFSVIGVEVSIGNREVVQWDQPMIRPAQEGLIAFVVKMIDGVMHFLVQAKLEAGNFDVIELAPTVQCLTGNYRVGPREYTVPYIDRVLDAEPSSILFDSYQSEEGGRFFKEQNRSMIVEVGEEFPIEVDPCYCWMTLHQLLRLIEFNNFLNIAARSLVSAVRFI